MPNSSSEYRIIRPASVLTSLLLTVLLSGQSAAQDDTAESGSDVLARAEQLMLDGSYAAASEMFRQAAGGQRRAGLLGASKAYFMAGNMADAQRIVEAAITGDYADFPLLSTQLAEVLRHRGEAARALEILQQVVNGAIEVPLRTLVQYGSLLNFTGQKEAANRILTEAVQRYHDGLVFRSDDVTMVALASWLLGQFHDANSLFDEATRTRPDNLEAHTLWADLFLEKYNAAEAGRGYRQALDINSRHVPALVGMARVGGKEGLLQRALSINPNSVAALETYGQSLMKNGREEEAQAYLERALKLNPQSLKSLSILAAAAALEERDEDYLDYLARVEAFSPGNAEFLGHIADSFGNRYRFDEAVSFARAAIKADPEYWQGYTLLGSNLVRLGEEEEGKVNLEIGFENDPFNVLTSNMLKVFDTLEDYLILRSEHFKVQMSERDAGILWPYLEPLLEESWTELTAKYGFEPEGPILIQVFENAEDFAVRSVGLPDIGPLVGICFGKVITLISPETLTANWQEIVWHEFMHVITLQMTKNRMPRWLSEGISVWEEREGRPYWGRDQGLDLVRAVAEDKLIPLAQLNSGFSGARTNADLSFAYFQSYLVVDYMVSEFGFSSLLELIRQYALIKSSRERFRQVFGMEMDAFDTGFRNWIDQRVRQINVHVHTEDVPDEGEGHGHGVRENSSAILAELYNNASLKQHMLSRIDENPRDFQAHLQLGIVLFKEESFEAAKRSLSIAHNMLPTYTGYPSPALVLSQIYESEGNREMQLQWLETLLQGLQHDFGSAMTLAEAALDSGDYAQSKYYLGRAIAVNPYRREVHELAARHARAVDDSALAVSEYEVLLKLEISDPVMAHTNLAEAYLGNGQVSEAKQSSLLALELAPGFRRAQQVLLESVRRENAR